MAYDVKCRACNTVTWAGNVVDLFRDRTNSDGRFVCSKCSGTDTFIYRISENLQEPGEVWERWIKGVIRIDAGSSTYFPYVFLTADAEDGPITGVHFHYYKDTRSLADGGKLKHGHGPGGPPVLGTRDLFTILRHLVSEGIMSREEVREFAQSL